MTRLRFALLGLALSAGSARAEGGASPVVEGAGIKVGDGTVVHPILGVETGVVQNVFYEQASTSTAGVMRIIGELAVGSLPSERMQMPQDESAELQNYGDVALRAELSAMYEEMLSGNDAIQGQGGLSGQASVRGLVFPRQTWQVGFLEEYARTLRALNFESADNIKRDVNHIGLSLRYRPKGRTLSGTLSYSNTIDYFEEDSQQFANRIMHRGKLEIGHRILPVTQLNAAVSIAYVGPLGSDSTRPTSYPLKATVGVASALTVKTSVNASVGFGKGFYSESDFTNIIAGVQLGYRFSPELRFAAAYSYDFEDSINANFYRDHALLVRADYRRDRFTLFAKSELRFRLYRRVIDEVMGSSPDRNDLIFGTSVGAIYNFKNWIAATADYSVAIDQTDFTYMPEAGLVDDPSYVRQTVFLGVRAAY